MAKFSKNLILNILKPVGFLFEFLLTRTKVTGLENIPTEGGPFIFAGNHASTYDPLLLMLHIPLPIRAVGPGDFKLLWPGNWLVEYMGVIRIQRGSADRESLKQMTAALNAGENLSLFPEGGTWEKRLDDVKPGATYLSLTTGARIIPVAIGGTYQVWRRIFRFQRPRISLHFEPAMPPMQSSDRKQRQQELWMASLTLAERIYKLLPPQEQARYNLHARQKFSGALEFKPKSLDTQFDFSVLAELVSKPNLFSPLYRNLKLPVKPFLYPKRFFRAGEFQRAATSLQQTFQQTLPDYLNYRLGPRKAKQALEELQEMITISVKAAEQGLLMRFQPSITMVAEPLPPND